MGKISEFTKERSRLNDLLTKYSSIETKKFLNLDSSVYEEGALPAKTKELLGLVSSLVLRCDDCVLYHLDRCLSLEITAKEIMEALNIGLIVGGSITIPHIRRAIDALDQELSSQKKTTKK